MAHKATSLATSNIAFVKYWGRIDHVYRLPANGSISMNLAAATTTTTVQFDDALAEDTIDAHSLQLDGKQASRVFKHIDRVRELAGIQQWARVATHNSFPMGAGIASSASAFAALTLAAVEAAGLKLSTRELSILARQGSGSACRSIPPGFVEWHYGETSEASFAETIAPPAHWDLRNLIAITQNEHKHIGSSQGNALVKTSPFNQTRLAMASQSLPIIRRAILDRNWTHLGEEMEREAIRLHVVAMTSSPPIFYWSPATIRIIQAVQAWRQGGLEAYFTIDAGANVHVLAEAPDASEVEERLRALPGVTDVIHNTVGEGT
ncbi:MAG: diphosphomevalonate decarboxylase, partial [Chloroflexi bacterium]|nr:diphosphomevalonate decarboxylase [Chloroflexota bacterium]